MHEKQILSDITYKTKRKEKLNKMKVLQRITINNK